MPLSKHSPKHSQTGPQAEAQFSHYSPNTYITSICKSVKEGMSEIQVAGSENRLFLCFGEWNLSLIIYNTDSKVLEHAL